MPSRLGRYAVRRRLGSGAFATVWLAYDDQLDSPVAVKVLADNWTEDVHVRQRFLEEGRYLRRVESPHVVQVYDAGELADGRPYLVMGYADQGTLADRLGLDPLEPGAALEVVRQVGAGLTALHGRGILHRDVKPANVLFRTAGGEVRAMLGDLGLGKALDASSRLTLVAGTPSYVAPEQALGEPLDARADQYALGALAYLLLTGRPPYAHETLAAAARPAPPAALSTATRPFADEVDAVVRRALAADREERWPDVPAFVGALTRSLAPVAVGGSSLPWRAEDPELTQAGALLVTARSSTPSSSPSSSSEDAEREAAEASPVRRRSRARRAGAVLVALAALAGGTAAGYAWQQAGDDEVTVTDVEGAISVTVPARWHGAVARSGWDVPEGGGRQPALSIGSQPGWEAEGGAGEGVFVGLLAGDELPERMPQHPECDAHGEPVREGGDEPSTTVVHTGCPGGVTVERVVQVAANRLLWVQVRSADRATAYQVLDQVVTHGL